MLYLRLHVGEALQQQWEVTAARTSIGRASDNDIVLPAGGVSKHHAVIEKDAESYVLIDLDSANGVFVNGDRVRRHTLKYWDEVQIFHYVLKVMAVARLPGESRGGLPGEPVPERQEATMEVDVSSLGDLAKLRRQARTAYLAFEDTRDRTTRIPLSKVNYSIGRAPDADIPAGGWLAPRLAAGIQRRSDGYYVLPARRGRVSVNGRPVSDPVRLNDEDMLRVRGLDLKFYFRVADDG